MRPAAKPAAAARTPKGKGTQPRVAVVLQADEKRQLSELARREGRSLANMARTLLITAMSEAA